MSQSEQRHIRNSFLKKLECVEAPVRKGSPPARALTKTPAGGRNIRKSIQEMGCCEEKAVYIQSTGSTMNTLAAAKKSRQGKTGRYLKCQLDPQVNHKKLSAQRRLQGTQWKCLRDAQAETRRAEEQSQVMQVQNTGLTSWMYHNYAYHHTDKTDHTYTGDCIVLYVSAFPAGY